MSRRFAPSNPTEPRPKATWRSGAILAAVVAIAVASFAAGGAALWLWFDPARLAQATPWRLLGLLGLFVLPAATVVFHTLDRRAVENEDDDEVAPLAEASKPAVRRHVGAHRSRPTVAQRRPRSLS